MPPRLRWWRSWCRRRKSLCPFPSAAALAVGSLLLLASCCQYSLAVPTLTGQPHIVFIVADDLGWNDVGFHGSNQIPTPNIDALCYNGVILNGYYSGPTCTPSRSALMTGKYPIMTGMQGAPLNNLNPRGLPLEEKILPEYLKDIGYATYAVGKWHLGMSRTAHLPTYRGFDRHFGYRGGFTSYYDYLLEERVDDEGNTVHGFDLYRNLTPAWPDVGTYATHLYTSEAVRNINNHDTSVPMFLYLSHLAPHSGNNGKLLEAPQDTVERMSHVIDANRRTYAAMVSELDASVGRVLQALRQRSMLDSSVVVFLSDNGAPTLGEHANWGSNWPLRGIKGTLWEGGVRVPACVWSRQLRYTPRVSNDLMHVTDWLPTLVAAAGGFQSTLPYYSDGQNLWYSLVYNRPSPRTEFLYNIDEAERSAAYRRAGWKLVLGQSSAGRYDGHYGENGTQNKQFVPYDYGRVVGSDASRAFATLSSVATATEMSRLRSDATVRCAWTNASTCVTGPGKVCLFDMDSDPCEQRDLSTAYPHIVRQLKSILVYYKRMLRPQIRRATDRNGDPSYYNFTYHPWLDNCYNCAK